MSGSAVASKGLTSAVLNTSKMLEEIGDLYAKQVNVVYFSHTVLRFH